MSKADQILPLSPLDALFYKRAIEPRYGVRYDASYSWGEPPYDYMTDGELIAGMVVTADNQNVIQPAVGGEFAGFLMTEASPNLNDTRAPSPPTVIKALGVGLVLVRNAALKEGEDYSANEGYVTSGTGADAGLLVPQGDATRDYFTVGRVRIVQADGVLMDFFNGNR